MLPVAEELGHAPGREHRPDARHEVADDLVARAPAVAVLVLGQRAARGARRDDERRVGDDEVEPLARDGLEHRPLAQLDGRAVLAVGGDGRVERGVERGEAERAARDVGGDDGAGVPGRVQRLDAAARPEVEHAPDRGADRHLRERERRPARAEHVVGREPPPRRELPEVGREPPRDGPRRVGRRVGAQVDDGPHGVVVPRARGLDEPEAARAVGSRPRERGVERAPRDLPAEEEERGEHGRRVAVAVPQRTARGHGLLAVERGRGDRAEHALDAVDREAGLGEVVAERRRRRREVGGREPGTGRRRAGGRGRGGGGVGRHGSILADARGAGRSARRRACSVARGAPDGTGRTGPRRAEAGRGPGCGRDVSSSACRTPRRSAPRSGTPRRS
ncbi:hypothetical protein L603_000200001700 [Cellulosimicrobium cellulans J34]|nr:hypothetical protein L603_000200001700 [Cellulosimicrobium cellulans J34]